MTEVKTLTDDTFDAELAAAGKPVIVDMGPWCGPCRMVGPVLEESPTRTPTTSSVNSTSTRTRGRPASSASWHPDHHPVRDGSRPRRS